MLRVLLIDPSYRGGIASYTTLIARTVQSAGGEPTVLGSRSLDAPADSVPRQRRLPDQAWGRPAVTGPGFYAGRLGAWVRSAMVVAATVRRGQPDVIHFQAALNRRFDAFLLRWLSSRHPVVWTAHDVVPFDGTERDRARFASIYRAADRVIVHTEPAANQLRAISKTSN